MYILTDYRLILIKDRSDLSSERADLSVAALASPAATVNYRLVLSSERADPSGTALARTSNNSKLQTSPLVREGATK
jgi:hypothetical protein